MAPERYGSFERSEYSRGLGVLRVLVTKKPRLSSSASILRCASECCEMRYLRAIIGVHSGPQLACQSGMLGQRILSHTGPTVKDRALYKGNQCSQGVGNGVSGGVCASNEHDAELCMQPGV
jgi:hypothetical protein